MKRALLFSLILHLTILCVVFFLKPEDKGKEKRALIAEIVTPQKIPSPPSRPEPEKEHRPTKPEKKLRMPKIAAPPKRLSEAPAKKAQRKTPEAGQTQQKARQSQSAQKQLSPTQQPPFVPFREYAIPREQGQESGGSKLFDRDVIAKSTQRRTDSKEDSTLSFNTRDYKYYGYMQRLKEKIENVWRYPAEAGAKGIYGDLYIRFTILKNGKLGAVELVRTSGNRDLDNAALKALREAEPFWGLPEDWGRDGLTITGHFVYTLRGYYIR
ncbi:MAG TPA: energy transducer TonB [Dissulfurispiraceae bacterium]|nr:energy transducer TonB [Dissulfurispiraceae bacterium]